MTDAMALALSRPARAERWKARLFRLLSWLFGSGHRSTSGPPGRILVIQLQQVGDSVIFTPALRELRALFPQARIDLLVNRVSAQLYAKCPHVDALIVEPHWHAGPGGTRLLPILPLLWQLRRARYDCVITDVTEQAFKYALIARIIGAPVRVGFDVEGRGAPYTVRLPLRPDAGYVDANLDVVRALGAVSPSAEEEVYFDADDEAHVARLLGEGAGEHPLVLFHVGSNWQSKTWFPERWAALADALHERAGASVALIGTPGERPAVEEVRALTRYSTLSLVGQTTIPQLAALISRCALFVGTDSGPRHVAGALARPQITIMSAQDLPSRWGLVRPEEVVLRTSPVCSPCLLSYCSHRTCMALIAVQNVLEVALHKLAAGKNLAAWVASS